MSPNSPAAKPSASSYQRCSVHDRGPAARNASTKRCVGATTSGRAIEQLRSSPKSRPPHDQICVA